MKLVCEHQYFYPKFALFKKIKQLFIFKNSKPSVLTLKFSGLPTQSSVYVRRPSI
ncbi:hypothetical protein SBDP1_830022 [Syntrophobacter sp. SbD1]|nr:hypothetical protein SBDP1_830022 [Syntrophobacter sp. SbD1]